MIRLRRYSHSGTAGFTLVEVLVATVLLGILSAVVMMTGSATNSLAATAGAAIVARDLEYAQSQASMLQEPITVAFYPGSESYDVSDGDGQVITHPLNKNSFDIDLTQAGRNSNLDIVLANFGSGSSAVTFSSLGEPVLPGGEAISPGSSILITCDSTSCVVKVTPITGRVSIE